MKKRQSKPKELTPAEKIVRQNAERELDEKYTRIQTEWDRPAPKEKTGHLSATHWINPKATVRDLMALEARE